MSFRVDLIADDERRSASAISVKSISRIGIIVIPTVIVFLIIIASLNSYMAKTQLLLLRSRWEAAEPKQRHAQQLVGRVNYNQKTIDELNAWKATRIAWHKQLVAIMQVTPETVRLKTLVMSRENSSTPPSPPVRRFTLVANSWTSGENAKQQVEAFESGFLKHPFVNHLIETTSIENYGADISKDAGPLDRVFQLECHYKELPGDSQQ